MKILLVSDLLDGWSLHNICKEIKKYLSQHVEIISGDSVEIEGLDRIADEYDIIHFCYTGKVDKFADFIRRNSGKVIMTIHNERSLLEGYEVDKVRLEQMIGR